MTRRFHILSVVAFGLLTACLQRDPLVDAAPSSSAALSAENAGLRAQAAALRTENLRLVAQSDGGPRWRETVQLGRVGRLRGHVPYLRLCPAGTLVSGLRGTAGALIDSIAPLCSSGAASLADRVELEAFGGARGSAFERACPSGAAIVGLRGRAGDALDAFEVLCTSVDEPAALEPTALEPVGGAAGDPFERRCPADHYVVGLSGWYAGQVESLSLHCAAPGIASSAIDEPRLRPRLQTGPRRPTESEPTERDE